MNIYHYASGIYSYASKSVTLKSVANTPSITVADSTVIRGKYLYVYLKDKTGKALSGQKVTFKVNGRTYTKTTNSNGRAALKFTLNAGKYYTQIYHYASGVYAYKKKALTVSVLKNTPKITVSNTTLIKNNNLYFYLKDGAGAAMKSAKLTITLNGKTYTRTTDSNGRASLYVSLAAKSYSLKASYAASSVYSKASISKTLNVINDPSKNSINNILTAASSLEAYVNKNKALPKTVTVGSYSVSIDEFSYLMAEAIGNLNNGNKNAVSIKNNIAANSPMNYTLNAKVYKAQYINLTKEILSFANANNYMPNYATVHNSSNQAAGKAGFGLYTFCFAKILDFYKSEGYLPKYCTFDSSVFASSSSGSGSSSPSTSANGTVTTANSSQYKAGLNVKSSEGNLDQYLVSSGFATITTAIKNKAASLTKGLTTNAAKATAIFNFVRDNIAYSYYANSKKGADGTLSAGSANCCDQANLVVALCRAAGIPARYSHAQGCTFSSGLVTGHVWAQIYIGGTWYSADATSTRNSLGNIKNWNTNSYYSLKNYATIPF